MFTLKYFSESDVNDNCVKCISSSQEILLNNFTIFNLLLQSTKLWIFNKFISNILHILSFILSYSDNIIDSLLYNEFIYLSILLNELFLSSTNSLLL